MKYEIRISTPHLSWKDTPVFMTIDTSGWFSDKGFDFLVFVQKCQVLKYVDKKTDYLESAYLMKMAWGLIP